MSSEKQKSIDEFYKKVASKEVGDIFALSYPIALIQKIIFASGETYLKENFNLINSEIDVLSLLLINGGSLSPTQLYDLTIFSSGGMTKVLKRLEDRDLIYRETKECDKRCSLVFLSKKGEDLVKRSLDGVSKECVKYFEVLDKSEQENLAKLLKKVLNSLSTKI